MRRHVRLVDHRFQRQLHGAQISPHISNLTLRVPLADTPPRYVVGKPDKGATAIAYRSILDREEIGPHAPSNH